MFTENNQNICVINLEQWLNWAGGIDESKFVALPMIQRGSVWKPKQIIDLWDSLLRGMPLGSLMVGHMKAGADVRVFGSNGLKPMREGGLGLIDGQQRTLSMLIAWPKIGETMDKRIWVDFADKPENEHLFRLHVTTKNHPFGFQKASPSAKLSLDDRRKARIAYIREHNLNLDAPITDDLFAQAKPWDSVLPIDLCQLIKLWQIDKNTWEKEVLSILATLTQYKSDGYDGDGIPKIKFVAWQDRADHEEIGKRVAAFKKALKYFFTQKVPLIEVPSEFFNSDESEHQDNPDPPLAILFKRIGAGGTALSDMDYIYSVIKHRLPQSYTLVEVLHGNNNIASLLSATDLVMTAVRLAAAETTGKEGKPLPDLESPTKQDFHRMLRHEDFLKTVFLPLISPKALSETFTLLTELIEFKGDGDIGLPKHAFPLLTRPLVQVLLRWIRLVQKQSYADIQSLLAPSRAEVMRFIMYWQLCVLDPKKASKLAFEKLNEPSSLFPGKAIYNYLLEKEVAIRIIQPETLTGTGNYVFSESAAKLRGWKRFEINEQTPPKEKEIINLYSRWWNKNGGHVHSLLLWLQRDTVAAFGGEAIAGRDEETPYDYDHICPSNHWYDWTGIGGTNKIIDFFEDPKHDKQGHWRVGNSIGNLRVWDSSDNRSLGNASPREKLKLTEPQNRSSLLKQSAIDENQIELWITCSGEKDAKYWDEARTKAFQNAVEKRAFSLYERFFNELQYADWLCEEPI